LVKNEGSKKSDKLKNSRKTMKNAKNSQKEIEKLVKQTLNAIKKCLQWG
jgi:hypothetical protein